MAEHLTVDGGTLAYEVTGASGPPGRGHLEVIDGAGHHPHVQFPSQVVSATRSFLGSVRA